MLSDQTILYLLVAANAATYLMFVLAIVRSRSRELPANATIEEAFKALEVSLRESFPDLPDGYTWKEVMTRLRSNGVEMDWVEIEDTLRKYEAFRYGGIEYHDANAKLVLQLARSLRGGIKIAD